MISNNLIHRVSPSANVDNGINISTSGCFGNILTGNQIHNIADRIDDTGIYTVIDNYIVFDNSNTTYTGAGTSDLKTFILPPNRLTPVNGKLKVKAAGVKSGGNDNKTIHFYFGSTQITFNATANDTTDWRFEAEIINQAASIQRISWVGYNGSTITQGYEDATEDTTVRTDIRFEAVLAGADTVAQRFMTIEIFEGN